MRPRFVQALQQCHGRKRRSTCFATVGVMCQSKPSAAKAGAWPMGVSLLSSVMDSPSCFYQALQRRHGRKRRSTLFAIIGVLCCPSHRQQKLAFDLRLPHCRLMLSDHVPFYTAYRCRTPFRQMGIGCRRRVCSWVGVAYLGGCVWSYCPVIVSIALGTLERQDVKSSHVPVTVA